MHPGVASRSETPLRAENLALFLKARPGFTQQGCAAALFFLRQSKQVSGARFVQEGRRVKLEPMNVETD